LQLKAQEKLDPVEIKQIDMETFDVAYHIIGGGDEGDKTAVSTKEEADHSLPYLISVALLDGQVMPAQYTAERIARGDVQGLLHRVSIRPSDEFSNRFPKEMPCRLTMTLRNGRVVSKEIHDYPGFITQPMSWEMAFEKFERITAPFTTASLRNSIADAVKDLDSVQIRDLTQLFHNIERPHSKRPVKVSRAGKEV
jgi:2-methylcitrate dehydratase